MSLALSPLKPRWTPAGQWHRLRRAWFNSTANTIISLVVLLALAWVVAHVLSWALWDATWTGTGQDCQARGGACWAFVSANLRLMLFGTYPGSLLWRPVLSLVLLVALVAVSMVPRAWSRTLGIAWVATPLAVCLLLGGFGGDRQVSTNDWGGLPLTLLIWTIAYALSFIVAVPLALARRSRMGGLRLASVGTIELIRGVPMLVTLYVSRFIVPMMLPGFEINLFFSIEAALVFFVASYLAEILRAGIQSLPAGQSEAARALGLSYAQTVRLIILPQALRAVIPALVNLGIGLLLSTPLVAVIGMTDFLSAVKEAASHEQDWPGCYTVAYCFAALVFFGICFSASRYSLWLEKKLKGAGKKAAT
ncbi:amino acid ABC transporter permease [Methylovirgula sp. 4M-Z18]|uniref:amino acid ABC transporter permease n=1 Tax=Methylovirgula sp. 4M-Z18 TaxID=2293567 RepID=UPI000E2E62B1|nr:amino acid ABC transporter permease [Methylovirgula sp. 4M-Z18]RFB80115.1 amino acid ABC transporter permease [Methylovirgula sp. 4M-Z18]